MESSSGATQGLHNPSSSSETDGPATEGENEGQLAQAFKDLAKGEKTATLMEKDLTKLEQKIDDLLASTESQDHDSAAYMLSGEQKVVDDNNDASTSIVILCC